MIAGFYEPDAGDIFLGERRINDVPAHRRSTAMVFQDYALFPHMTVGRERRLRAEARAASRGRSSSKRVARDARATSA